ncbi:MAG: hypothetical protein OHK93_001737 [Ramalina farinacea]|uniref:Rhodopsin domain-containing protein n=1 Tax=Ramalina farinacea TaxID=258253 RepID=A0AA43TWJ4_9LECA|nr:hypothetical protein [Ramalina farinacea]
MSAIPSETIASQLAWKNENDGGGLYAFCIAGIVICGITVILRLWSRKLQKMQWQSDDYTLIAAMVRRHFFTFNILYNFAYPLSRISLVLLYRRIFLQQWFCIICLIFVGIFTCFAIATALTDVFLTIPVNARWDHAVEARHSVDQKRLFVGNAAFNIATDILLLLLPIIMISRLQMNAWHKVGVAAIFWLGILTIIATICRLHYSYRVDESDVTCTSDTLVKSAYWTAAEQFLGILCPCLITFRPLLRSSYLLFSGHRSSSSSWFPSRRSPSQPPKPSSENTTATTTTTASNAEEHEQDHGSPSEEEESIPQYSHNTTRRGYLEMDLEAQRKRAREGVGG